MGIAALLILVGISAFQFIRFSDQISRLQNQLSESSRVVVVEEEGELDFPQGFPRGMGSTVRASMSSTLIEGRVNFKSRFDSPPVITIYEVVDPIYQREAEQEEKGNLHAAIGRSPTYHRDRLKDYEDQSRAVGDLFFVRQNGEGFAWTWNTKNDNTPLNLGFRDNWKRAIRWRARGIQIAP